jgi:hypothetical protein
MIPKEKAHELIVKALVQFEKLTINEAKKISLIAVDELINQCWSYREIDLGLALEYWEEVKQEIESYEL